MLTVSRGLPHQPVVPLLFYLPPHTAGSCKAMCEAETRLCGRPWHRLLAQPLCRCQEKGRLYRVLFVSSDQMLDVFRCKNKSIPLCRSVCVFRRGMCAIQ